MSSGQRWSRPNYCGYQNPAGSFILAGWMDGGGRSTQALNALAYLSVMPMHSLMRWANTARRDPNLSMIIEGGHIGNCLQGSSSITTPSPLSNTNAHGNSVPECVIRFQRLRSRLKAGASFAENNANGSGKPYFSMRSSCERGSPLIRTTAAKLSGSGCTAGRRLSSLIISSDTCFESFCTRS
jgi:hypothetical protein